MPKSMMVIVHAGSRFSTIESIRAHCKVADNGCWIKQTAKEANKYAHFVVAGKQVLAHRLSWQIANGAIPAGLFVCHKCNNKRCMNPDHLYLATSQQNTADAVRDGLLVGWPKGQTLINANKTHCVNGHALSGSNVYRPPEGGRYCRECRKTANRAHKLAKRNRALAEKSLAAAAQDRTRV